MKNSLKINEICNENIEVMSYLDYREFLSAVYAFLKINQKHYSYEKFSEDLGFGKTNVLFLIIKGKRPLTLKAAKKIISSLGMKGDRRIYFERLVQYQNARTPEAREKHFKSLLKFKSRNISSLEGKAALDFYSEWYHAVIFEMCSMEYFNSDPDWISDHMEPRIRPAQAEESIKLLEELGLIEFDQKSRRHRPTSNWISTGDDVESLGVVRFHQKMIEMGKESITRIDEGLREVSSITISVPEEDVEEIKDEIRKFRKALMAKIEKKKNSNRVYQLNMQLFPLSKKSEKE